VTGYRELCAELAGQIRGGQLRPGEELPGVRELARRWGTAASTVSHAQRALADAGLIELADRRRARITPDAALAADRYLNTESVFTLAGSDDPALDVLVRQLSGGSLRLLTGAGSFAGLSNVRHGRADGAAIHLLHHTGVYNAPFALGLLRGLDPHLVHLWQREQGLLLQPGNPTGVRSVADLIDRRVAGRAPGTGTRVLTDRLLRAAGADPDAVRGPQFGTHLEVALAVATGMVDVAVGVRSAANDLDLEFLPLTWEDYDVALPASALGRAAPLITALRTADVRATVTAVGGYNTSRSGEILRVT
jgi:putative molybdopterin biosynthesis protein